MNPAYIDFLHQATHTSTDDPEDTMTVALTQAELAAICLGTHLTMFSFPCLEGPLDRLTAKLIELIEAQRPDWADSESWGDHGTE